MGAWHGKDHEHLTGERANLAALCGSKGIKGQHRLSISDEKHMASKHPALLHPRFHNQMRVTREIFKVNSVLTGVSDRTSHTLAQTGQILEDYPASYRLRTLRRLPQRRRIEERKTEPAFDDPFTRYFGAVTCTGGRLPYISVIGSRCHTDSS